MSLESRECEPGSEKRGVTMRPLKMLCLLQPIPQFDKQAKRQVEAPRIFKVIIQKAETLRKMNGRGGLQNTSYSNSFIVHLYHSIPFQPTPLQSVLK